MDALPRAPDSRRRFADPTDPLAAPADSDLPDRSTPSDTEPAPTLPDRCEHRRRPRIAVRHPAHDGFLIEVVYACDRCIERVWTTAPLREVRDRSGRCWPVVSHKTPRDLVDEAGTGWTVELTRGSRGAVLRFTSAERSLRVAVPDERHPHVRSRRELLECLRHRSRRIRGRRRRARGEGTPLWRRQLDAPRPPKRLPGRPDCPRLPS